MSSYITLIASFSYINYNHYMSVSASMLISVPWTLPNCTDTAANWTRS